jgi:hypothetical protein
MVAQQRSRQVPVKKGGESMVEVCELSPCGTGNKPESASAGSCGFDSPMYSFGRAFQGVKRVNVAVRGMRTTAAGTVVGPSWQAQVARAFARDWVGRLEGADDESRRPIAIARIADRTASITYTSLK